MKTRASFTIMALIAISFASNADIKVSLPKGCDAKSIQYYYAPVKQFATAASRAERGIVRDSVAVSNGKAVISTPQTNDNLLYGLNLNDNGISLYLAPGETINVDVTSTDPFSYSLSGTPLANGMNELLLIEAPFYAKVRELNADREKNADAISKLGAEYNTIQKNFITSNPGAPAAGVALLNLEGEDFITLFDTYSPQLSSSIIYPLVEKQYQAEKKAMEAEKKQQALASGSVPAPNFTLKNLEGKDVSLSDFLGKWVILDFWGSWCPWCIKGFPELKDAYQKYDGRLEIIGIDCNEGEAEWRAGVEKYQLPWIHVYNPQGGSVTAEYGVQGYPTKAIIDPEGKIRNITVGHNPEFFVALTELMGE